MCGVVKIRFFLLLAPFRNFQFGDFSCNFCLWICYITQYVSWILRSFTQKDVLTHSNVDIHKTCNRQSF